MPKDGLAEIREPSRWGAVLSSGINHGILNLNCGARMSTDSLIGRLEAMKVTNEPSEWNYAVDGAIHIVKTFMGGAAASASTVSESAVGSDTRKDSEAAFPANPLIAYTRTRLTQIATGDYRACGLTPEAIAADALIALRDAEKAIVKEFTEKGGAEGLGSPVSESADAYDSRKGSYTASPDSPSDASAKPHMNLCWGCNTGFINADQPFKCKECGWEPPKPEVIDLEEVVTDVCYIGATAGDVKKALKRHFKKAGVKYE